MLYFQAKGKFSFFGSDFVENELLTKKELIKWTNEQIKQGAGKDILINFLKKEFDLVEISKSRVCWIFGARFIKEAIF